MRKIKKWTCEEERFLIKNYEKMFYSDIASHLNRSVQSVRRKITNMGLRLSDEERLKRSREVYHKFLWKEDSRGDNNNNWKGGISDNNYHYKKLQVMRHPEKVKARAKVAAAVKSGKLVKEPCVECGDKNSFAHHEDYSKPLDVIWLCRWHHRKRHDNLY